MTGRTLQRILRQTGTDHFYLMHLSYGDRSSREPLWNFAKRHRLIGLSFRGIDRRWDVVSDAKRMALTSTWRYHFEKFSSMEQGDVVLVVNGQTDVLGVACVTGEYEHKKGLSDDFFSHVRNVKWLLAYDWANRKPAKVGGFRNTILRIEDGSPFWRLTKVNLNLRNQVPAKLRHRAARLKRDLERKYGVGGEGFEHRRLKHWVIEHPESVVRGPILRSHEEYVFDSGDRADIIFDLPGNRHCVIEIETEFPTPGAFQALKYRTLKCAELGLDLESPSVEAVLVAWNRPESFRFCKRYGIRFVKKILRQ